MEWVRAPLLHLVRRRDTRTVFFTLPSYLSRDDGKIELASNISVFDQYLIKNALKEWLL
jgi:hypothetical protein